MSTGAIRLPYTPPFDAVGLAAFLAARAVPGVEEVDLVGLCYRRSFRLPRPPLATVAAGTLTLDLRPDGATPGVVLRVVEPLDLAGDDLRALVGVTRHLLDLDHDPQAAAHVVGRDPVMAPIVARVPGLRVPGAWDSFELAVRAVLGQQVSVAAARTLLGRLAALAGPGLDGGEHPDGRTIVRLFPSADELAMADLDRLGMPASRRRTLRALAEAVASGQVELGIGADPDTASAQLQALPGIGPWTAAYVVLRALKDGDSLLVGDLALARAAARQGLPDSWPALIAHAERWRPWRGYASFWLWSTAAG